MSRSKPPYKYHLSCSLLVSDSLRQQFVVEGTDEEAVGPLHGSDNPEKAASEVNFFFPVEHTFCAIKPHMGDRGQPKGIM